MDRIIEVKVNGSHLSKDNNLAGVQHEANAKVLRIEFDPGWDGWAKKVTFWNAVMENPVERTLTADLLEDMLTNTRIYLCPIPGEAMTESGELTFVIDGYSDGKRQRSLSDQLKVKEAPYEDHSGEPTDPTPSQAEQLQVQIDTILDDMQERAVRAENAAQEAEHASAVAVDARDDILNMTASAEDVSPYEAASVEKTDVNGQVNLHFRIPHGKGGVYVGTGEMPPAYEVQVNPEGARVVDYIGDIMAEGDKQIARVQEAEDKLPTIGDNGNWYIWDKDAGAYADSGEKAQGVSGVYVGSGDMPEGYDVQIDPNGSETELVDQVAQSIIKSGALDDALVGNMVTGEDLEAHNTDEAAHADIRLALQTAANDKVAKSGDTMTGDLTIAKAIPSAKLSVAGAASFASVTKNANASNDFGTNLIDAQDESNFTRLLVGHKEKKLAMERIENGALVGSYALYHEGNMPKTGGATVYTATIGTNWTEDSTTGVKSQTVAISGITIDHTAKVDCVFAGNKDSDGYAAFVDQQNQYLEFITNGYAETVEGGITFYIFGDPNTVSIPIVVEVV